MSFEEEKIINQLESIGCKRIDEYTLGGACVFLYDFGEKDKKTRELIEPENNVQ